MKCSFSKQEAYSSLRDAISEIKDMGLSDPIVHPEVAFKVLASLLVMVISFLYREKGGDILLIYEYNCLTLCLGI